MQVEQAVFTSARTARMAGYHLVGRSAGIAEDLAHCLSLWGPTHGSLLDSRKDASGLSFFPVDRRWLALARTVYGGPEYSARGGRQIVTTFVVMDRQQFRAYGNNPLAVFCTAFVLGHLRWLGSIPEKLPPLTIPDEPLQSAAVRPASDEHVEDRLAQEVTWRLGQGANVALIGTIHPLPVLAAIFQGTDVERRSEISFTSGLRPSVQRSCRILFLPASDSGMRRQLESLGITCLSASHKQLS